MIRNVNREIRISGIFRTIVSLCIIVTLFLTFTSCKEDVIEEEVAAEETIVEEEVSSETEGTTQNETPPVVEGIPETEIEWEGVTFSPIEGLRFDEGTFYFLEGNKYGGVVGEKAGVLIPKDAVEVNGVGQGAFGFDPRVVEAMQKEIIEKDKEFRYPLPFNLEEAKGIKIRETEVHEALRYPEENRLFDKDTHLEISNIPSETIIYSPSNTLTTCREDIFGIFGGIYTLNFNIIPGLFKEETVDNHRMDDGAVFIKYDPKGAEFISKEIEEQFLEQQKIWESDPFAKPSEIEIKMGAPLVKITDKVNLKEAVWEERPEEDPVYRWLYTGLEEVDYQIEIGYIFHSGDLENLKSEDKGGTTGLRNLLEIGGMKIFILPAYE